VPVAPPSPSADAGVARQEPPAPLPAKPSPFPAVARTTLGNGLKISVVEAHALPVIEVRAVVHAGSGFGAPGVADMTGTMLKEGGTRAHSASELVKRTETLGSSLSIDVGADATNLSMAVVRGQIGDALGVLGEVLRTPRFDPTEFARVKTKMHDEAEDAAQSDGSWMTQRILFQTLYPPTSPYAIYGASPTEVSKLSVEEIRAFHKKFFVSSNVELIVAGDIDMESVRAAADKAFGDWKAGSPPPKVDFPAPIPPEATRVIVADRPRSVQSDVIVTELLPERHSPSWPDVRVAMQVLGAVGTGRLFADIREKRSLAYRADARPVELAHGPLPMLAYAGTQAPKTADAVQGLLDDVGGMHTSPPSDDEVASARRFLTDVFAVRMETVGTIASMVAQLRTLDLPDDYWDTYRAALRTVTTAGVDDQSTHIFGVDHALIIVAGDADVVSEPLARFGEVTVVDPQHDFKVMRTLPKSPPTAAK
jgi:predicted Zn-dependent peptidase